MSLNIKNKETCQLTSELAPLTGETITGAITVPLKERLERERRERSLETRILELHTIGQRCAQLLRDGPSATEHGAYLYDEHGLPQR